MLILYVKCKCEHVAKQFPVVINDEVQISWFCEIGTGTNTAVTPTGKNRKNKSQRETVFGPTISEFTQSSVINSIESYGDCNLLWGIFPTNHPINVFFFYQLSSPKMEKRFQRYINNCIRISIRSFIRRTLNGKHFP